MITAWQTRFLPFAGDYPRRVYAQLGALKWLGLALMVVDHFEAFVLHRAFDSQLGRLVFPLFAIVLGYNLAQPGTASRVLRRCLIFGCLALPFHAMLTGHPLSLNVLFTFAAAAFMVQAIERDTIVDLLAAVVVYAIAGYFVEYAWAGIALVVGVRLVYLEPDSCRTVRMLERLTAGVFVGYGLVGLCLANGNATALLALPIVYLASRWDPYSVLGQGRQVFWWFYPLHLAAFWILLR